ncbi:MAG: hypothetical protein AAGN35_09195 [Bacteroidota bacterium]
MVLLGLGCAPEVPAYDWSGEWKTRVDTIDLEMPHRQAIEIRNRGAIPIPLQFSWNRGFLYRMEDVLARIAALDSAQGPEAAARRAWQFVAGVSHHGATRHDSQRRHHPLIFLNSLGDGHCDDLASVLAEIWRAQGYRSRVWNLEGHVVPEVEIAGQWQVYDPDYNAFYRDRQGQPLGVAQLQSPQNPVPTAVNAPQKWQPSPGWIAPVRAFYHSRSDNALNPWYDSIPRVESEAFHLPPGAWIRFHSTGVAYHLEQFSFPPETRAALDLFLPDAFAGRQAVPLRVLNVSGVGELTWQERDFRVGEAAWEAALKDADIFLDELEIRPGKNGLRLTCALNPYLFPMRTAGNRLELRATHPSRLAVSVVQLAGEREKQAAEMHRIQEAVGRDMARYHRDRAAIDSLIRPIQHPTDLRANLFRLLGHLDLIPASGSSPKFERILAHFQSIVDQMPDADRPMIEAFLSQPEIVVYNLAIYRHARER